MKTSLTHLPKKKRDELKSIVSFIIKEVGTCEMIILFGSYARGDYVEYDERMEFGIPTTFMSDYDILVLTSKEPTEFIERKLDKIDSRFYNMRSTPIQFLCISVAEMNKCLSDGRYLYTDIKREGIMLHDSKKLKLVRRRPLHYDEIKIQAQEYFTEKFGRANSFLRSARHDYDDKDNMMAAFHLHQACENYFLTILLTFTLYTKKLHNLKKLLRRTKKYSDKLSLLFPNDTEVEKKVFNLLHRAYIEARYNASFEITTNDIDLQLDKVATLRNVVNEICIKQINMYSLLANGTEKQYIPLKPQTAAAESDISTQ